ncbi:DNA excision repair protein ERCC-6-like 2 isoform X1 [Acipenser ruthenus]|uniref:DNA excision repair protein ERCC-6-like 2 isoform X1 n=1 Tax=Acipenser ruthenus TaxID=7906 RepID=UPI002740AB19|nr:DNA excision repair protein ERCC-6-like 2 isoform X1 [Acipenser ruthenus]XP_058891034.1 DNA excision repair protein ERCC-6-like 2 isoform X1 [Acipenser ruthenus]XP_058891037.1 DNA excision repair protein ERCC-6-like 2 isoform X1 [Acipenser ruthenus]
MESESQSESDSGTEERWCEGDRCLAPYSGDGKLYEARIKTLILEEQGKAVAVVTFVGFDEETVSVKRLQRIKCPQSHKRSFVFDDEDLEKPFFHDRKPPGPAVPCMLSEHGECIPYTINRYLRDYQREGVRFIYSHYVKGRGCILGDDMGLGKTVQVISFLAAVLHKKGTREDIENNMPEFLRKKKESRPIEAKKIFLIVAPLSVLYNWKDELDTWGYFRGTILHGTKKEAEFARVKRGKCEFALTTYETLRLCLSDFNSIRWSAVIVDEAHKIKNPNSQITQAMKALKCNVRVGLTGTILQNNMEELWCVMDWAIPGCLGSLNLFKAKFSDPVEHGQKHDVTKRNLAMGRKAIRRLARKLSRWFLRRTKSLISCQLPKKDDRVVYCSLTEFQQAVYKAVLESEDVNLLLRSCEPCSCNSGLKRKSCCYKKNKNGVPMRALYFSYLMILRKVANHAALLQSNGNTSKAQEVYVNQVCMQVFNRFPDFVQQSKHAAFETISDPKYSGKMKVLHRLLEHCRGNKDKVLLFSLSTKLLDVLEKYCMAEGIEYRRLDGNTKSKERVKIVKEFNSTQDINICLVSTMAGGLGLNFVGANIVVLFDPTWNPANDLQAIDRAYRIGQCRDVKVFRLISLGTVEEIIYLRQVYKQQLQCAVVGSENAKRYFEAVQGSEEHSGELFGIQNLFRMQTEGSCLTKEILERDGRVESGIMTAVTRMREQTPVRGMETTTGPNGEPSKENPEITEKMSKASRIPKGILDFSSDSEEDHGNKSKSRSDKNRDRESSSTSPGQVTLLHCGFSKLLDGNKDLGECNDSSGSSNMESSESQSSSDEDMEAAPSVELGRSSNFLPSVTQTSRQEQPQKQKLRKNCALSSKSEGDTELGNKQKNCGTSKKTLVAKATHCSSEENDDVIPPSQVLGAKRKMPAKGESCSEIFLEETEDSEYGNVTGQSSKWHHLLAGKQTDRQTTATSFQSKTGKAVYKSKMFCKLRDYGDESDESDDIEIPKNTKLYTSKTKRLKQSVGSTSVTHSKKHQKHVHFRLQDKKSDDVRADSQRIDNFSSSEDDVPTKKVRFSKNCRKRNWVPDRTSSKSQFASTENNSSKAVKKSSVSEHKSSLNGKPKINQDEKFGSMDTYLDGVQEVAYAHSNQRIVGASKAENRMSRSAMRDVFELKRFSQIPANLAVCSGETLSEQTDVDLTPTKPTQVDSGNPKPLHQAHPVTQTESRVHRVGRTTFFIGETPKAICRKQLTEIAAFFRMASVEELAELVVRSTPESRQTMLRDFYCSQHAELKDILTIKYSKPLTVFGKQKTGKNPNCASSDVKNISDTDLKSLRKGTRPRKLTYWESEDSDTSEDSGSYLNKCKSISKAEVCVSQNPPFDNPSIESGNSASDSVKHKQKQRHSLSVTEPCRERSKSEPNDDAENENSQKDVITELLGDTSILDGIFNMKNRNSEPRKSSVSCHVKKAKSRPKDVWDILNEGNEECVNRLTDLSVVEGMCNGVNRVAAKTRREDQAQGSHLWKKNEKFLWKKYEDQETLTPGTSSVDSQI